MLLAAFAALLVAVEIGFRLGRRRAARSNEQERSHISALQAALLGLLALLLGFTFAMAVARSDARRGLVIEEANAIGTTVLRARLLPPSATEKIGELLRRYVRARLDFYVAGVDPEHLAAANATASELQEQLWEAAREVAREDPYALPVGLFVQSLNELIDVGEERRTAFDNHVPETVLWLLFAASACALGYIGFGSGLVGRRRFRSTAVFSLLIALVLAVILDLDRPRRGLIRVSQASLERLLETLEAPNR